LVRPLASVLVVPWLGNIWVVPSWEETAVGVASLSVEWNILVPLSIITFLTTISNSITTTRKSAVGSASVGLPVRVDVQTKIAFLITFNPSVTANWWRWDTRSCERPSIDSLDWSGSVETIWSSSE